METSETSKQRTERIQIDYYRHRGGLFWMRFCCVLVGLIGAGVYAAIVIGSADGNRHVSTGPLANVHASFEHDCRQCHKDFTPLASDAFQISAIDSLQHTESACQACHRVGKHYRSVMTADWKMVDQNCSICHRDHLGRDNNLAAITNQQCAQCHANLQAVCMSSHQLSVKTDTASFTLASHGDFRSLTGDDPGRVKFDHQQHMLPGQVNARDSGGFTIEMLEADQRERYRHDGQSDEDFVRLDCSSCHQFDGNPDLGSTLISDAELGRYLQRISFEEHCSACHSINPPGRTESTLALPHAAPWAEIDLLLRTKIAGTRAQGTARSRRDDSHPTPLPGIGAGANNENIAVVSPAEVVAARELTQQQCLKCHDSQSISDDAISQALSGKSAPLIPPRWLKHGLYDHAAHRKIDCRYCHEAAYPDADTTVAANDPKDHERIMIGGIETCTSCHRPTALAAPSPEQLWGGQPTWASDNCTLCHRYHAEASP